MPRTCFVIMPFSKTKSCTEDEWTNIFNDLFKPIIENAGLGYQCRRSVANRGNIVAGIIRDLNDVYLVVADLTDRNANVFYELGVRHSLKNRTILLAQNRDDIPFDLEAYANHVYDWRSEDGRAALKQKLTELLVEVDSNPDRSDNPVSDFLQPTSPPVVDVPPAPQPSEIAEAQSLIGPRAEGLDAVALVRRLATQTSPRGLSVIARLTEAESEKAFQTVFSAPDLNPTEGRSLPEAQVFDFCVPIVQRFEPYVAKVEQFVLESVQQGWQPGLELGVRIAGRWISISQRPTVSMLRPVKGTPQLLAWRLLILSGARALADEAFDLVRLVLAHPIEEERPNAAISHRPLFQRRDLFWPEAFLGNANHGIRYLKECWSRTPYLHDYFGTEEEYHISIGQFLMVVALAASSAPETELYPGYRLLPHATQAMARLCGRIAAYDRYCEGIAQALNTNCTELKGTWNERVQAANNAKTGGWDVGVRFPARLGAQVEGWDT